ncbi:hypothetical protein A4X06_0g6211 [Tilletia controversa]|uniref:Uncharacterized protein n=2 Tax=Tilletia TaxID=13289 RepID=A0A8X7MP14_9BASI|nr:hypothetical protein CF336_g5585 [Tilletia laevis]KAE8192758.1 hypothetical protein CF328_g5258 [Tilletia controversa]KAE8195706.1 hypothetical protein CF335_g5036 [Tilletia laevis]KAE8240082.1 hypothetical protein A4X03_0g8602 [Tilletia caries]KAE8243590.1 hypothetical protein A4X06_0g6211 [Tilletia controversa]
MPRVARPARDVVVRVPKVLPYTKSSNNARDTTAGTGAVTLDSLPAGSSHHASSSSAVAGPGSGAEIAPVNGHVGGEHRSSGGIGEGRDGGMMNGAGGAGGALPQTQHLMLKAETSAAEWNSLLIWARRQRGPQWDTGTAVWQVDRHSQEYYSFCANPTQNKLVRLNPSAAPSSDARAGAAITTAGAGAGAGSLQPTPTLPSNPSFPADHIRTRIHINIHISISIHIWQAQGNMLSIRKRKRMGMGTGQAMDMTDPGMH